MNLFLLLLQISLVLYKCFFKLFPINLLGVQGERICGPYLINAFFW